MRNLIIIFVVVISSLNFGISQSEFGIKIGISSHDFTSKNLINRDKLKLSIENASYGFEFGLYGRIGILGLNLQPELLFSSNTVYYRYQDFSNVNTVDKITSATYNKVDIPILLVVNAAFFKFYLGPVGQYEFDYIKSLFSKEEISGVNNKLRLGYQLGAGVSFNGLTIDLRYESNFSDYINSLEIGGKHFDISNRPSRYITSLWFKI